MARKCEHFALVLFFISSQPAATSSDEMNSAILPGSELLDQCSRSSPPAADGIWSPTSADIDRLEALLPSALAAARRARDLDVSRVRSQWIRQYVGIMRDGRRYLYGSFFPPVVVRSIPDWRTKPIIVCDGGPGVFGIEMDVETGKLSHLELNGP